MSVSITCDIYEAYEKVFIIYTNISKAIGV